MKLLGARFALGPNEAVRRDLEIRGSRGSFDLRGYIILPGLVNAHDHLEFNLYPRLGRGPYANAGHWARDVYHPEHPPISDQRRISKSTRLIWGGLKNLLCGVTTVCHHNPMEFAIFDRNFPVRVVKQFGWAHSIEYSPDLAERFRQTPSDWPFVVHLAEGTDRAARREIFALDAMGALDSRTILVHAVGLDKSGLALVKRKKASIVWCPSSNDFLLGKTLDPKTRRSGIDIALGSDSAVTAAGDLLDELRIARELGATPEELYRMVTEIPARMLRLPTYANDFVIFKDQGKTPAETLLAGRGPEMVILDGHVKLIAPAIATPKRFHRLKVAGRKEVFVDADVPGLYRRAHRVLGNFRLAGRRVSATLESR
jgi:cytosine/adenosine deaminase-related metal-dependent hydrolase